MSTELEFALVIGRELIRIEKYINEVAINQFKNPNLELMVAQRMTEILIPSGDGLIDSVKDSVTYPNDFIVNGKLAHFICYGAAICVASAKGCLVARNFPRALYHMTQANRFVGNVEILFENGKKAAEKANIKNAEHQGARKMAIMYYSENHQNFKNKDDAALFIGQKIVGYPFSTVRGWLKGVNHQLNCENLCDEWPVDWLSEDDSIGENPDGIKF